MFSIRVGNWLNRLVSILLACAVVGLGLGPGSTAVAQGPVAPPDPHLPPFAAGRIDSASYLRLRAEAIAQLRGLPYSDPGARVRAIQALENLEQLRPAGPAAQASTTAWTSIGPAPIPNGQTSPIMPVSGRVTAIAIHPLTPTIVYVGTAQGGLYRTLNGGTTWTPLMDSAQSLAIGAVTIDPLNPSTVFVGTGEGNISLDSFFGVGVYRISNADTAPVLAGPFETRIAGTGTLTDTGHAFLGTAINRIVVDPNDDSRLFVGNTWGFSGMSGDFGANPAATGLYFTANALAASPSFSRVSGVPGNGFGGVTDIVFEPSSSDNLLVGELDLNFSGTNDGIYRTSNASAASQTPSVSPIFTRTVNPGNITNFKLAINKVGLTVTVAAAMGYAGNGQLVTSADGGQTWPITVTTFAGKTGFCDRQCWYDMALAMDPADAGKLYLGGAANGAHSSVLVQATNGSTFVQSDAGLHADEHAMAVAPSNPSIVYTGNDGGVWKSVDSGANWTSLNNSTFSATQFESLAVHPSDRNFTIGGTQDNGTNWYKPDGTWTRADFGDGGFALIDQSAVNTTTVTMYHTYFNQTNNLIGLARVLSTANAQDGSWDFLGCGGAANGIGCGDSVLFYAPMALGPGNPNTLYFGTDRLYRSTNRGGSMQVVSQAPLGFGYPLSAIGISPQSDNVRIVGTKSGQVFATTTGSLSLTTVTAGGMPADYVARAVIDPNHSNTAYVTFDGYGFNQHIWKTTNLSAGAAGWAATNFSVDVPVNAFVVDPADSQWLYAGTDVGVYASTDGGQNWAPFGTGLPRVAVFDMAIQNSHRVLRIATHGRGLWEIPLPTAVDLSILKTVVPGSASPHAPITYTLAFSNTGPGLATGVLITDVVPSALTGLSFISSGALLTATGGISYTWAVADLSPGQGGIITITGQLNGPLGALPRLITNTATITTTAAELNPLNNSSSALLSVQTITQTVYLPLVRR